MSFIDRRQNNGSNYAGRNQTTFNDIRGGIKSVQRGDLVAELSMNTPVTIPIAEVDPDRCDLNIFMKGGDTAVLTYALSENGTAITISTGNSMGKWNIAISWQVIEHY